MEDVNARLRLSVVDLEGFVRNMDKIQKAGISGIESFVSGKYRVHVQCVDSQREGLTVYVTDIVPLGRSA